MGKICTFSLLDLWSIATQLQKLAQCVPIRRNTVIIMQIWCDTYTHLDMDIKVLPFLWYASLFEAHHAAVVHHCSAPQRISCKNLTFLFFSVFRRDSEERKCPNKKKSFSAPLSVYFSRSTFFKIKYRLVEGWYEWHWKHTSWNSPNKFVGKKKKIQIANYRWTRPVIQVNATSSMKAGRIKKVIQKIVTIVPNTTFFFLFFFKVSSLL